MIKAKVMNTQIFCGILTLGEHKNTGLHLIMWILTNRIYDVTGDFALLTLWGAKPLVTQ